MEVSHLGDILAIPFFAISLKYFYEKKNKNILEKVLLLFSLVGLLADIAFTLKHFHVAF
jgi:hypothetical protein